ncbi:phosphotransferase [Mycobacterium frederiksbergense]|uniref:ecdysteroid 22-kinase family protein n=1 Tax=Mycolicibacterium frederiksbergense TaxID=117567 RepID=UPI0021F36BD3|nr:ecdysteroid 22-kinase family protein [Mycolicibacterium frederiksbergense]MCV7047637.1 phosphotransferase [Mycolicibacterium frederiksbergense]
MPPQVSSVTPVFGLAAHLGRGMQRIATDAIFGRARAIPRHIGGLDAAYLSGLLGRSVTSVSLLDGDAGTSSRARLALSGTDVPGTVFVKMPAETAATRMMGELGRLADTEVRFYRELSGQLGDVPVCHGAALDPVTGRFVLVLEDLAADGQPACEFPDTLHPLDPDRAALIVELLARVHATFWRRLDPYPWVYTASGDATSLLTGSLANAAARRLERRTAIPVRTGQFINDNYRAVATLIDRGPHTIMHGDAHPGNVYFRNGRAGLLDWQAVRRGHPSRELSYTLITSMTTDARVGNQRELLDMYRAALHAAGGPEMDRDELWQRYRQAALYAYVATLITAGMGGMQDEGIAMEGLGRAVSALEELDTVYALKGSL